MFYQLLHTGCILKTLPGRFGFLFWYQRFSSSDPINQCAAPGFRHGERGPVVLMLNVYFFFSSFLFSFFLPHPPSSFKDLLSSLFKTYRLNTGGWIFQWGQTWDICHWNIDDQPCTNKKKRKEKKGWRFKSIVEFRLSSCVQTGGSDFSSAASWPQLFSAGMTSSVNWPSSCGWMRADWGWKSSTGKKVKSNEMPFKVPQVLFDVLQCQHRKWQKLWKKNWIHYSSSTSHRTTGVNVLFNAVILTW